MKPTTKHISISKIILMMMVLLCGFQKLNAQIKAEIKTDTTNYLIGDKIKLDISISNFPAGAKIIFPTFQADTAAVLELIEQSKIDTGKNLFHQTLTYMVFDSGTVQVAPIKFFIQQNAKADSFYSNALQFHVTGIAVDTMKTFRPIKKIVSIPYTWHEFVWYYIFGFLIVIIIVTALYFILKKKKISELFMPAMPELPAHEWAMLELKNLAKEQLPQKEQTKLYYTRLTDTLRMYIEKQFKIAAMESTSDELIDTLKKNNLNPFAIKQLDELLRTADLVKFAKSQPMQNEHDLNMQTAENFVITTIPKQENPGEEK